VIPKFTTNNSANGMSALRPPLLNQLKNSTPKSSNPSEKTPNSLNKLPSKPPTEPRFPRRSPSSREPEEEPTPRKDSISMPKNKPKLPPRKSEEL